MPAQVNIVKGDTFMDSQQVTTDIVNDIYGQLDKYQSGLLTYNELKNEICLTVVTAIDNLVENS